MSVRELFFNGITEADTVTATAKHIGFLPNSPDTGLDQ